MGYGKRHMGKMKKSEDWVAEQSITTKAKARSKLLECEQGVKTSESEIYFIEIRKRTWQKRARLLQELMETKGWTDDASSEKDKVVKRTKTK